ncbi:MAG: SRPBCC family protein [Bacteroidota bacterium]|nr:SRPBCC family protein [Bacteroidota bacterium]MDP4205875.1 SRPBCC family protein [Bacteroidota bacterium]
MGISKYSSDIKIIPNNQEVIYNFLSNLENLNLFVNPESMGLLSEKVPQLKISDFSADKDSCKFTVSGFGETGLRIVEREPFKTIKLGGNGSVPFEFNFWIQLLPVDAYQTKLRLTLHADLNMMMKMLVGKKIEEGINKVADALTAIPYR